VKVGVMNNIQEDDWADDTWSRHSGMYSVDKTKAGSSSEDPDDSDDSIDEIEE